MDIAGSAVGIISLGIQLCNGIISYYNGYRRQDADLDKTLQSLETLKGLLISLDAPLNGLASSSQAFTAPAMNVEECITQCNTSLVELQNYLDKCRDVLPAGSKSKRSLGDTFKIQVKKALFPFRRDSLDSLKDNVDRVRKNLDTAFDILHLNVNFSTHEQLSVLADTSVLEGVKQAEIQESLIRVETHAQSTSSSIPELAAGIARSTSFLETNIPSIQEKILGISNGIPKLEAQILLIPQKVEGLLTTRQSSLEERYHARFQNLETEFNRFAQSAMGNPSFTRALLDDSVEAENASERPTGRLTLSCSCRPAIDRGRTTKLYGPFIMFRGYSSKSLHSKDCIYWDRPQKQDVFGLQLRFSNSLLQGIVGTSMSMIRGAGGYSIAPSIHFRPVVPRGSPGFALISQISSYYMFLTLSETDTAELGAYFEDVLLQLRKAFADKSASVFDTDILGNNLLHAACSVFHDGGGHVVMEKFGHILAPSYRRFLIDLCTLMINCGAGVNEPDIFGKYPLDIMVDSTLVQHCFNSDYASISVDLANAGAKLSSMCYDNLVVYSKRSSSTGPQHTRPSVNIARYLASVQIPEDITEVFRCGALCQAVLHRSEERVKTLLVKYPEACKLERTVLGQTPLHAAIRWPSGLRILLEAFPDMIEIPDDSGALPLTYACYLQCEESVAILLNADSPLDSGLFSGDSHALYAAIQMPSPSIKQLIITTLANRRRRLLDLALTSLGPKRLESLTPNLTSEHVLDADAKKVYDELISHHIPVPNALSILTGSGTVYHRIYGEDCPGAAEIAEMFHQAGFRDLNSPDWKGLTPLMTGPSRYSFMHFRDYLQYTTWLALNGAEWDRKAVLCSDSDNYNENAIVNDSGKTVPEAAAVHYVAHRLGQAIRTNFSQNSGLLELFGSGVNAQNPNYSLLGSVCVQTDSHICQCACSFSDFACLPTVILLRSMGQLKASTDEGDRGENENDAKNKQAEETRQFLRKFTVNWLCERLELKGESRFVAVSILRFLTFEKLELRHTCCILDDGDMFHEQATFTRRDEEEVREIRDEYREGIAQLEELVDEFVMKYVEEEMELRDFLEGYWMHRMGEVLRPGRVDADELRRIEELGIVFEDLSLVGACGDGLSDGNEWETEDEDDGHGMLT
ncbi:hypothetical protein DL95DRAFT_460743 [Leptodontidium sp. 2 PMI_412]|nr:hypothetical protein DL95DRAFT_460743 [Leptodontidium sp. 2 PMI_412]